MKRYLSIAAPLGILASLPLWVSTVEANGQSSPSIGPAVQPPLDLEKLLANANPTGNEERQSSREDLEAAIKAAQEPLDQATAHAALANWLLAVPTARPATRWIIDLARPEDLRALAESAAAAREHLSTAASLLKNEDPNVAGSDKSRRKRLTTSIEQLKATTEVFAAAEAKGNEKARQEAWSNAAVAISEARESENGELSSAATLWQAMAWDQARRRERALTVLPEALAKPEQPFDFMSRLLRCRILGDADEYATALALATQICFRVRDWYPTESDSRQRARQRLVGLLQLKMGREWMKELRTATQPANAQLLDAILADVQQRLFPPEDKSPEIYVMPEVIPILVKPPTVKPVPEEKGPEAKPSTKPAAPATGPDDASTDQDEH